MRWELHTEMLRRGGWFWLAPASGQTATDQRQEPGMPLRPWPVPRRRPAASQYAERYRHPGALPLRGQFTALRRKCQPRRPGWVLSGPSAVAPRSGTFVPVTPPLVPRLPAAGTVAVPTPGDRPGTPTTPVTGLVGAATGAVGGAVAPVTTTVAPVTAPVTGVTAPVPVTGVTAPVAVTGVTTQPNAVTAPVSTLTAPVSAAATPATTATAPVPAPTAPVAAPLGTPTTPVSTTTTPPT